VTASELAQQKHQQLQAQLAPQEKLLGMLITSTSAQQLTHGNGQQSQRGDRCNRC
jgi:multidrug efflux pump subunit AcrA (membrane-fusion protein)